MYLAPQKLDSCVRNNNWNFLILTNLFAFVLEEKQNNDDYQGV